jgi:hypothetical protein
MSRLAATFILLLAVAPGAAQSGDALGEELRALREALAAQQRHIEQLSARLERMEAEREREQERGAAPALSPASFAPAAPAAAPPAAAMSAPAAPEAAAPAQDEDEKRLAALERALGRFAWSGDLRLRYEPFFGGTLATARHRARFRLRVNVATRLSDEISGGFSLATGDDLDPISRNQTMGGFFQRKSINLDRAFVTYAPQWAQGLELAGGRFAPPFYHTQLTLDNDVNVEGVAQSYSARWSEGPLRRLSLVAFQLPFREVSAGPNGTLYGGQVASEWRLAPRLRFSGYGAFYDWQHADGVRAAQTAGTLAGNPASNAASATQFASRFGILDLIARFDLDTGAARWPLLLQFNLANNTRACTNRLDPVAVPCNPRDRTAYWAEAQVGRTREPGDLMLGYTFLRLEREAVLAAFNYSNLRLPTNSATHRLQAGYQVAPQITLNYTAFIGRQLVTATSPTREPYLKRMQVDLNYRF